jgi:hypothetical protein
VTDKWIKGRKVSAAKQQFRLVKILFTTICEEHVIKIRQILFATKLGFWKNLYAGRVVLMLVSR